MNLKQNTKQVAVFLTLFYLLVCFLSLNRHSKAGIYNYHSEIWADKAGYYVFLPALFIYNFQSNQFPAHIDVKTGSGFSVDTINNKIITKYTCGVALMEAPFFIVTHLLAKRCGFSNDGFSSIYNKMIDIAGVFYMVLAFAFLYFFLARYVLKKIAFIGLSGVFLGTNVFYYSIFETGMSHVYSFFLFSVFLYLTGFMFKPEQKFYLNILFGLVIGLIIVVRPINVIFLPVFFLFNQPDFKNISKFIFPVLTIILFACIPIIPQLIYWKYSSGHFFTYAYKDEGFTNLLSPKMIPLWFSTDNGLVTFSPLVLFVLGGIICMRRAHPYISILIAVYFLFISYMFSSWWAWDYGCGYGSRPFVEYYALFSLPFSFFIQNVMENKGRLYILGSIAILCIALNLKIIFSYDGCWYGGSWDWPAFYKLLTGPTK